MTEAEERHPRQLTELQRRLQQQTETAERLEKERRQQQDTVAALQQQVRMGDAGRRNVGYWMEHVRVGRWANQDTTG